MPLNQHGTAGRSSRFSGRTRVWDVIHLRLLLDVHMRVWSGVEYTPVKFKIEVQATDQFESHRV